MPGPGLRRRMEEFQMTEDSDYEGPYVECHDIVDLFPHGGLAAPGPPAPPLRPLHLVREE